MENITPTYLEDKIVAICDAINWFAYRRDPYSNREKRGYLEALIDIATLLGHTIKIIEDPNEYRNSTIIRKISFDGERLAIEDPIDEDEEETW